MFFIIIQEINKLIKTYTSVFEKQQCILFIKQVRMFCYYFIGLNMLRFLLVYKNKIEFSSTSTELALKTIVIITTIADIFRFSIGDAAYYGVSHEFNKMKKLGITDKNGKKINDNNHIHGINKDYIYKLTCEYIGYQLVVTMIGALFVVFTLYISKIVGFFNFNNSFIIYMLMYIIIKYNLIFNSLLRHVGDTFSKSYISLCAASIQCIIPIIGYKILSSYNFNITLPFVIIMSFLASISSLSLNIWNVYRLFNNRIFYPSFNKLIMRLRSSVYILPGLILSSAFTFAFIDILMATTLFDIVTSMKLSVGLAFRPVRNIQGMILLPLLVSFNLNSIHAENNKSLYKSMYIFTLTAVILCSILSSLIITTKIYKLIFYIREEFPVNAMNAFIYLFPLKLADKSLEIRNVINGNNKFYNLLIIIRDLGAIIIFNILYYYLHLTTSLPIIIAYTMIFQSLSAFIISLSVLKYYDKNNDISLSLEILHLIFIFFLFSFFYNMCNYFISFLFVTT